MAFIDKTMFEVTVSNSVNNQTQNVPGKFGTGTGAGFTAQDCSAGLLCVQNGLIPSEGYESVTPAILNGNTWFFNAAANGNGGMLGDHTGIYAFNNYDVNKAVSGSNQWNVGAQTLGLGLPAGNRGDFCEIIVGEQYTFGSGNFSTAPTDSTYRYATIANGLLVASTSAPAAGSGVYFEILRQKPVNEGTTYWGVGYVLKAMRAEASA
jgi:hypothetical protein